METPKGFFEEALIHKTQRGDLVRSKSEVIIANLLYSLGVKDYQYERELSGPDGSRRYPDFTVEDAATGLNLYWEHLGMLNDSLYEKRWKAKLQWYEKAGIRRWEDGGGENGTLLVTEDGPDGSIDSAKIERRIHQVLGL